jgi:uncharacterized protein (DUF1684 family)
MMVVARPARKTSAQKAGTMTVIRSLVVVSLLALALPIAAGQDASYLASIARWRASHQAALRADEGWLTVVGLAWLKAGVNRAGTSPDAEVRLPAGAPRSVGVFRLSGDQVTFEPAAGAPVALNGKPASSQLLRPDVDKITSGGVTLFIIKRAGRYGVRIKDRDSEARRRFRGETWYPVREAWRVVAKFEPYQPPKMIPILNVLGQTEPQPSPGAAVFVLDGREYRLDPISEGGQLFFIFKDATSGVTTYSSGRFLYASPPANGQVILDFNKAENPPCAFTDFATCPLPPRQNQLTIGIDAGERYAKRRH